MKKRSGLSIIIVAAITLEVLSAFQYYTTRNLLEKQLQGRTGIFAFAICMNLLQVYNLFLAGVCRTIQSFGAIQIGKSDNESFLLVLHKSFTFITIAMMITCGLVWIVPEAITQFFGASDESMIAEGSHALRIFSLSFIPFC